MSSLKSKVITLYKTLLFMGRDYPHGYDYFRSRAHRAFMKNRDVKDTEKIEEMIKFGEYIVKELEALYMLKKYRTMKRRYYNDQDWSAKYEQRLNQIDKASKT